MTRFRTRFLPLLSLLFILAFGYLLLAVSQTGGIPEPDSAPSSEWGPYLHYLKEFTGRRRVNVHFKNEQSIFHGAQFNFVNVGQGNLTFARRDLVSVGRIPLVVARVYDSAGSGSNDFGPGWHLAAAERIEVQGGAARLFTETGAEINFVLSGDKFVPSRDFPSDYVRLQVAANGNLVTELRTGFTKEFVLVEGAYRLTRVADRNGNEVKLFYQGKDLARMENGVHFVEFARDANRRVTEVIDDLGRTVLYSYDQQGNLTRVTDVGGNIWYYQYTAPGQLHRTLDPLSRENFKVWYTPEGRVQRLELPFGRIAYEYDSGRSMTTVIDRKDLVSRYVQNEDGITTRVINPLGEETSIVLDASNNVAEILENGTTVHELQYDGEHRLIFRRSIAVEGPVEASYSYDSSTGQLTRIEYSDGRIRRFQYDARGNLVRASVAGGGWDRYAYSPKGDLTELIRANGEAALRLEYDAQGLITGVTEGPNLRTSLGYEARGKLAEMNLSSGLTANLDYDALGLRHKLDVSDGSSGEYVFDPAGNLVGSRVVREDGAQEGQSLELDDSYKVIRRVLDDGRESLYSYDRNGNLVEVTFDSTVTRFEWDELNRITAIVTPEGDRLEHSYAPGEPSLVDQSDVETGLVLSPRRDSGLTFGPQMEVLYSRSELAQSGAVRFSEALGRLQLSGPGGKEILTPEVVLETPLQRLRLLDREGALAERQHDFQAASNLFFLPPEYATINCCTICEIVSGCSPCAVFVPPTRLGGDNSPTVTLSCPSPVTRGENGHCSVRVDNAPGATIRGWKFVGGGATVNRATNTDSFTWPGVMVTSGTVSVEARTSTGALIGTPSVNITVNSRSWHTNPVSPTKVLNGTFLTLPVPPKAGGIDSGLGAFSERTGDTGFFSTRIQDNGPNHGFAYFASQLNLSPFDFRYIINPDLENKDSVFSKHQWGACGFISWTNLFTQTNRHEFNSATQSHHGFYASAMNLGANNPGDYFESRLALPGANLATFEGDTRKELDARYVRIFNATNLEPKAVNETANGVFLGNINYSPYAPCN